MPRYRAFISYSHADARFAAQLHKALEAFRVPAGVGDRSGLARNRIGPVFRDISDLGAAPALPEALTDAIRDSESLIVVCSQEARDSQWVRREIVKFRELHGDSVRILAVISPRAGSGAAEAMLPEALSEVEPLAADARRNADGFKLALLKIVAGLLSIGLDELVRRDAKRRQTKLVAVSLGSGVLACSMAVLALLAVWAREDAQRRLSQSETLISFMLGDLREQLMPLGHVRILESVGDQALEYFESLQDADLTDDALLRKSRALYQIGDVYFELGQFDAAQSSFQSSLDQARILATAEPANNERLYELAQAEFWVGYAAWEAGDLDTAQEHLGEYAAAARILNDRDPDNRDWAMEAFYASNNLGTLASRRYRFDTAQSFFEDALERIGALIVAEATPDALFERSTVLSWLGSTQLHRGNLTAARDTWLEALAHTWDDANAIHQEERAYQLGFLSDALVWLGELEQARTHAAAAATIAASLSSADSDSMDLRFALLTHGLRVARIDYFSGSEVDYPSLQAAASVLIEVNEPPSSWRLLAISVADLGIRVGDATAADWARTLLDPDPFPEASGEGVEPEYLDLTISLAQRDQSELERLQRTMTSAMEQYESTQDFLLVRPLLRGFELLGDMRGYERMIDILVRADAQHPEVLAGVEQRRG